MVAVELLLGVALLLSPPEGEVLEGPAPSDEVDEPPPSVDEPPPSVDELPPSDDDGDRDVQRVVEAAAQAAKERAYLERNNQDIGEYVRHLDALADVGSELDTCGRAIQAELRMALALAYLKLAGTCSESGEVADTSDAAPDPEPSAANLPLPVLECMEATGPSECAGWLLERVAEFADVGPSGNRAPFAQAFGCSHAVAEMSVEQMFGSCMVDQYDQAVTRWQANASVDEPEPGAVWPVPRWASIAGISGGAALIIGGAVMLGIDGKCPGGYDPVAQVGDCPSIYNTNVGGGVLVGVGTVVMVGMGVVLAITEVQRSKQGDSRPSALRRGLERAQALTGLRLSLSL